MDGYKDDGASEECDCGISNANARGPNPQRLAVAEELR